MKLDNYLTPYTRINSKWFKNLNIRPETIKLPEEDIYNMFLALVLTISFYMCLFRQGKQKQINNWDYIKLKKLLHSKETINKVKR